MSRKPAQSAPLLRFHRHQHLAHAGQTMQAILTIREGWAARYSVIGAGRRQITALYLPGDYCEPQWLIDPRCTAPVMALTEVRVSPLALGRLRGACATSELTQDLWRAIHSLLERQSAWIVSLGRKSAVERVCSVLDEIVLRTSAATNPQNASIMMPLTQIELADVVGLTPIHVNRVLGELKRNAIVDIGTRMISVLDPAALRLIARSGAPPAP